MEVGHSITYGSDGVVTFDSGEVIVMDDGTGVDVYLVEGSAHVRITRQQAMLLLMGLRLTGTNAPDWLC